MIHDMYRKLGYINTILSRVPYYGTTLFHTMAQLCAILWHNTVSYYGTNHRHIMPALRTMCAALLLLVSSTPAWSQSEGVYYIPSNDNYNAGTSTNNWYLVPGDNPQKTHKADAFFNDEFCNKSGKGDYTGDNYGDPEKPFLTTYKTNKDAAAVPSGVTVRQNNSVWILKAVSGESGFFYLIHAATGKYVVYEPPYKDAPNRKSMHLLATDSPGENAKFAISGSDPYTFRPKSVTSGNRFFNIAGQHYNNYYTNPTSGDYIHNGMLGLYTAGNWKLEPTLLAAPTITVTDGIVTVTDVNGLPSGYNVRYTTDGTDPTASSSTLPVGGYTILESGTFKAVIERYGIVLTGVASQAVEPSILRPTFTKNADGSVTITAETDNEIYYTLDGTDPTTSTGTHATTTIDISLESLQSATAIKALAHNSTDGKTSGVATLPINTYTYKVINKSDKVATSFSIKEAEGKPLTNYNGIPADIRSEYLSGETVTFYSFAGSEAVGADFTGDFDEHNPISATPAGNANIYVTYTTTHVGEKFLPLTNASPYNIKTGYESSPYTYLKDTGIDATTSADEYKSDREYLWYVTGNDPYNVTIQNVKTNTNYLNYSSPTISVGGGAQSFIIKGTTNPVAQTETSYVDVTFFNSAVEAFTVEVNTVKLPITFTLIDKKGEVIQSLIPYDSNLGLNLPVAWRSPLVTTYHYWKTTIDPMTSEETRVEIFDVNDREDNVILVTYDVDNTLLDLDGRNSLNVADKVNKTYMLNFSEGQNFNQEDGSDGVMGTTRKAVYPYNNGDGALYVYGSERWTEQLASGASTRSRWLWVIEPANNPASVAELDPYHVLISSYQTQTSYKIDDTHTRSFHSYLRTYQPTGHNAIVTGVTNDNPLAHGGEASADPDKTDATVYMILGTSLSTCHLMTRETVPFDDGVSPSNERRIVNTFEQYWKNNPTCYNIIKDTTGDGVTEGQGVNVALSPTQQAALTAKDWHVYQAWANAANWSSNPKASKSFADGKHWFQTINMGSSGSFTFEETTLDPMLILLDQHGWEIARMKLPSDPSKSANYTKNAERYATIHKYNSPMVARYHYWKTGSKVPGYHKFKVSEYATTPDGSAEYTSEELGVYNESTHIGNLPDYTTQGLVGGKERDWYVTYDVKPEYANAYAGAATAGATQAAKYLVKQGDNYASYSGLGTTLGTESSLPDDIGDELQWYVRPNFDIDEEMGYQYDVEKEEGGGGSHIATETETNEDYFNGVTPGWSNGFDPYNVQIQSVKETARYLTAHTTGSSNATGIWTGSSDNLSVQNENSGGQTNVPGDDQTQLQISNSTFMVVDDGSGNMVLMPRFDNAHVVNSFVSSYFVETGNSTSYLTLERVPTVVTKASDIKTMGGYYALSSDFDVDVSVGTSSNPFMGTIDGRLYKLTSTSRPLVAYAQDATIKNIIFESVGISSGNTDGHVGAVVATAKGNTSIYNCGINGGSVSGTNHVGGIVGHLEGYSRVINCYSYADVAGGTDVGGIVGYNAYSSTQANLHTMVMNCMFYGDITGGTRRSPVYGGNNINNLNSGGLNTFNYYAYDKATSFRNFVEGNNKKYNCALAVEERFLTRFEIYRQLLNSNKKLAAIYATGDVADANKMAKWVLETADRSIANPKPYPVLKAQGKYPSIINYDAEHAPDSAVVGRNNGGKLGRKLTVHLSGTGITTSSIEIDRTDKDFDRFNYNYDKIQLPYFNDVGTGNYTDNNVVTGWKIISMTGGTAGTYTASDTWGGYNFADRKCTNKDIYSESGRVFSQGAYFDVPYGVTDIYIEPYWGKAAYLADASYDVVYNTSYSRQDVPTTLLGTQAVNKQIGYKGQKVYTNIKDALADITSPGSTVYDNAIVLVGNFHQTK